MRKVFFVSLLSFVLVLPSVAQEKDKLVTAYMSFINYVGNGHNERLEVVSIESSEANTEVYNGVAVVTVHFNQYDGKVEYLYLKVRNTVTHKTAILTYKDFTFPPSQWGLHYQYYFKAIDWFYEESHELTNGM